MREFQMYCVVFTAVMLLSIVSAFAQSVEKPNIVPGDTWTYRPTHEQGPVARQTHTEVTVIRVGASDMLIGVKEVGSTLPPREQLVGNDWSRSRNVNGVTTVVNRPLNFPLAPGKSWPIDYKDDHPANHAHQNEHIKENCTVIGWEDVAVPAGTFKAVKIECEGEWTADLAPDVVGTAAQTRSDPQGSTIVTRTNKVVPQTVTGKLYKAFWYVPEVKRMAKLVEEYFDTSGVRNVRNIDELESFKVGP